jgi:hypothetical protein
VIAIKCFGGSVAVAVVAVAHYVRRTQEFSTYPHPTKKSCQKAQKYEICSEWLHNI